MTLIQGDNFYLCTEAVNRTAEVLHKLGFTIHPVKSVFTPSKLIRFLGFILNCEEMSVTLTDAKKGKLQKMCQEAACLKEIQIQHLAEHIRHLNAALSGVQFGSRFVKRLEILKNQALSVSQGTIQELLRFVIQSDRISSGGLTICSLLLTLPTLIFLPSLFTLMLLKQGVGVGVGGECNGVTTGGPWTEAKSELHINCFEL